MMHVSIEILHNMINSYYSSQENGIKNVAL